MTPGQLDRGFVGFRAGVAEECLPAKAVLGEQLRPAALYIHVPGVGYVNQPGRLILNRFDNRRRAMAQQVTAPAGEQV